VEEVGLWEVLEDEGVGEAEGSEEMSFVGQRWRGFLSLV
jgi:hypothetical protein